MREIMEDLAYIIVCAAGSTFFGYLCGYMINNNSEHSNWNVFIFIMSILSGLLSVFSLILLGISVIGLLSDLLERNKS